MINMFTGLYVPKFIIQNTDKQGALLFLVGTGLIAGDIVIGYSRLAGGEGSIF